MKWFKLEVKEVNIGVADETYPIAVKAELPKDVIKKLVKYLENKYEDKITFIPYPKHFEAYFQKNGGKLEIKYV